MQKESFDKIGQYVTEDSEGYTFSIDVSGRNFKVGGALVESISMFVAKEEEDCSGDMAVGWCVDGLQNDPTADTMGTLLLRNFHSNDEVTAVMSEFYWKQAFNNELHGVLMECGFSEAAVKAVGTSEWGMQDEGRASYDAYDVADEVRAAMAAA
jgi:hypothetical protein